MIGTKVGRYQIEELLGQGGMGVVYKAHDPVLGRAIALKFLLHHQSEDDLVQQRFIHEARATSALDHPNICTIHDIGTSDDGSTYIAMAYYEGETLKSRISQGSIPVDEALSISIQIAEGLLQAHNKGIVHRDIKPANIFITTEGLVKILDFGIAKMRGVDLTKTDSTMGTAAYMSPEQAQSEEVDARSDIWSLGVILYEMLAGMRPFRAAFSAALVYAILHEEPTPMHIDLPGGVSEVLQKALSKELGNRFSTMAEMLDALYACHGTSFSVPTPLSKTDRHTVGRDDQLAVLGQGLEQVYAGSGLLIGVSGEAGIGKTTVVEEFLSRLSGTPAMIAKGQCSERLAGTEAYLPFFDILGHLLETGTDGANARMMREKAPWWFVQVASVSPDDPANQAMLEQTRHTTQEQIKRELVSFLKEASNSHPLILFIEDMHWADVSSVDLVAYLGARFEGMKVLIVTTYRPVEMQLNDHPFLQIKPDLVSRGQCREIELKFLDQDEIEAYLELEYPSNTFPDDLAELIHNRTEGSPLFMADLIKDLEQQGIIEKGEDGWHLSESIGTVESVLPNSVRAMIERKVSQLNEEDRQLMVVASVQGFEFDSAVLALVLEKDEEEVEERLQQLEKEYRFVEYLEEDEFPDRTLTLKYRFVHVLYQNDLYDSLTRTKRVRLSRKIGQMLEEAYGEKRNEVASELARLFEEGREYKSAFTYYKIAAEHLVFVFAYQEGYAIANKSLGLLRFLEDTPEHKKLEISLQITIGSALTAIKGFSAEGVGVAYERVQKLYSQVEIDSEVAAYVLGLQSFFIVTLRLDDALKLGSENLRLAKENGDRGLLAAANNCLGVANQFLGYFSESIPQLERVIDLLGAETKTIDSHADRVVYELLVQASNHLALSHWVLGYPDRAIAISDSVKSRLKGIQNPYLESHYLGFAGFLHQFMGNEDLVLILAESNVALSEEHGFPLNQKWASMLIGWTEAVSGKWEESLEVLQDGLAFWQGVGMKAMVPYWHSLIVPILGRLERYEDAKGMLDDSIDYMESTQHRFFEPEIHRVNGDILKNQGADPEEVASHYQKAINVARKQKAKSYELRAVMSLGRLWQEQGKTKEAYDLVSEVYNWFTEGFDTRDLTEARELMRELQSTR